ncbi:hypothetical protein QQZ08_003443 [Neonectria magnoliae]|uniref:ABM domain-containing protein n=1 Tax=Neonectria magnoliae TaxID=2732573 RepID=A0ABR1IBB7_9HYPO
MAPIQLTAIITPKPGKAQRFLELFEACVQYVQANEPAVHRYELHKGVKDINDGKEQFVVLEGYLPNLYLIEKRAYIKITSSYNDQAALDDHMRTPPVVAMLEAFEKEHLCYTEVIRTTTGPGINKAQI